MPAAPVQMASPSQLAPPAFDFQSNAGASGGFGGVEACAGGGAWDLNAWDRGSGRRAGPGPDACLCVDLGAGPIHTARWDASEGQAVVLRLASSGEAVTSELRFTEGVSAKRLNKFFRDARGSTSAPSWPKGVSCGSTIQAEAGVVKNCARLLGLGPPDGCGDSSAQLKREAHLTGIRALVPGFLPSAVDEEAAEPDGSVLAQVAVPIKEGREELVELLPEQLVGLLLFHLASRAREKDAALSQVSAVGIALAVPSWWGEAQRAASANAVSAVGLELPRLCSRALCAAAGLGQELENALFRNAALPLADGDTADGRRCARALLLDANEEGVEAVVLELEGSAGTIAVADQVAEAVETREWRILAAAGSAAPGCSGEQGLDLVRACMRVLRDIGAHSAVPSLLVLHRGAEIWWPEVCACWKEAGNTWQLEALPVLHARASAAAEGLAGLIAAEAGALGAPTLRFADAVPEAIGVVQRPAGSNLFSPALVADSQIPVPGIDVVFERGAPVPGIAQRTYARDSDRGQDLDLTMLQQEAAGAGGGAGPWRPCSRLLEVLTTMDDDMEPVRCDSVTVVFRLDAGGLLTTLVEDVQTPPPLKRRRRSIWVGFMLLVLLGFSGLALQWRAIAAAARHSDLNLRLHNFFEQYNPKKIPDVDKILQEYHGKEDLLVQRLEKKYKARFPAAGHGSRTREL